MYLPFLMLLSTLALAQTSPEYTPKPLSTLVKPADHLTLEAELELAKRSTAQAAQLDKQVSIAVLDAPAAQSLPTLSRSKYLLAART